MAEKTPLPMALVTVTVPGKESLTVEAAAAHLGVQAEDIDAEFGVVPVDRARGVHSVRVRADKLPDNEPAKKQYEGPFSNPKIEPFGPVR